ncbi:MAG: hypothetical protein WAO76_07405 [Georgfuchsia sp.]
MQHKTHNKNTAARFYVNTRRALVDRKAQRTAHTGYSMGEQNVTRSELQTLADLLNEPEYMSEWDAGGSPNRSWYIRLDKIEREARLVA